MIPDGALLRKSLLAAPLDHTAKADLGLDHCEARSWHAWHRHMTLVMAALAFLANLRADLLRTSMADADPGKRNERSLRLVAVHS